jgi:hypothetical protein
MPHRKHSGNTLAEFTIQLAQRIDLGSIDSWEVDLCEFSSPPSVTGKVYVISTSNALSYCDLITQQFVGSQYSRCLRTFIYEPEYCDHTSNNVNCMRVEKHTFQDISISIADLHGKKISFESGEVSTKVVL